MNIRQAMPTDAELLTNLAVTTTREAFGPPHNPAVVVEDYIRNDFTADILRQEIMDRKATFFIVEQSDGQMIGYAKLRRRQPPRQVRTRPAIEIQRIYLLQHAVGQGLGRKLMEHCLTVARDEGYAAVWLGVWEHNRVALDFYARMGFTQVGWHYFLFGTDRQRDFWLQKQL